MMGLGSRVWGLAATVRARTVLVVLAATLGIGAAIAGSTDPRPETPAPALDVAKLAAEISREDDHVTALELAEWIRDRKAGLRVIDVRTDSEYAAYHIPSAEHAPLPAIARMRPRAGETLVLYSAGGAHAAQAWVLLRASGFERVYFLRGGLLDWMEDVMSPAPADARAAALSRYFGGVPRADARPHVASPASAAGAVARMKRRGC